MRGPCGALHGACPSINMPKPGCCRHALHPAAIVLPQGAALAATVPYVAGGGSSRQGRQRVGAAGVHLSDMAATRLRAPAEVSSVPGRQEEVCTATTGNNGCYAALTEMQSGAAGPADAQWCEPTGAR